MASIRFYYGEIPIFLLKDELNGRFSTTEIEKNWNVSLIEYPVKKFGWSAAKMHFYVDEKFKGKQFLVIDSDIVFIGRVLDQLFVKQFNCDVIINEEKVSNPHSDWFKNTYYDLSNIKSFDPNFQYNGYTFNCGQLFCKGGFLKKELIDSFFDFNNYPSWKRTDIFPLVDQSLFNYLFPKLETEKKMTIGKESYMIWSEHSTARQFEMEKILKGKEYPYLVHWAGATRLPLLEKMSRSDILIHFETYYYQKVSFGWSLKLMRKVKPLFLFYSRVIYSKFKKVKHSSN